MWKSYGILDMHHCRGGVKTQELKVRDGLLSVIRVGG